MKHWFSKFCTGLLACAMVLTCLDISAITRAAGVQKEYELYPSVQEITYDQALMTLKDQVNVVVEDGIDQYTQAKIEQVMGLKGYSIEKGNLSFGTQSISGRTNVMLGLYGSGGAADVYMQSVTSETGHFDNFDAYTLSIQDDVIAIVGRDSDATFYGITTLKEIFQQVIAKEVEQLIIYDYADIQGRGFIEGYYGNPWSVEDRAQLMRFGGDYKLNNYIYAPKDDPYHNSNWRALYDEEKLKDIAYLAQAGNESKCYYVYALHTFMHNAVRFDSEEHYQEDLEIIKNKFTQVMNVGVRQFAILADDAGVPGGNPSNYVKLMKDLSDWMKEKAKTVSGLKTTILFCPHDYMGWGTSDELQTLKQLPASVPIIQTGGKIWGEASPNFIDSFYSSMNRPVYLWINWPCSDNTKNSLIMDGNEQFLVPGIDSSKVSGIVLNPMQQSEANKSALFANADYTWNVWESNEEARQNWEDSFKYMDHQSALDNDSSIALRELSRHMKNSNTGDHGESTELAPKLNTFLSLLQAESDYSTEAEELLAEFTQLKEYAAYYKANPGNERTRDQIIYWLDCWGDSMDAGIYFLRAAQAIAADEDTDVIWDYYSAGQAALELSKTHSFHYVDHLEYATIGSKYIQPFLTKLESELSTKITPMVNPNIQLITLITSRNDNPSVDGAADALKALTDGKLTSEVTWKNPTELFVGDYIGLRYTKPIELKNVTFYMGRNGNNADRFTQAKLQYTTDGKTWVDIAGSTTNNAVVSADNLNLKVLGVRIYSTQAVTNKWLGCREIEINANRTQLITNRSDTPNVSNGLSAVDALSDKSLDTQVEWTNPNSTQTGDYIGLMYDQPLHLNKVTFKMGSGSNPNDTFGAAKLQYTEDGVNWLDIDGSEVNTTSANVTAEGLDLDVMGIRIIATADRSNMWLICREIEINKAGVSSNITLDGMSIYSNSLSNLTDDDESTYTWLNTDGRGIDADATITMTFTEGALELTQVRFAQNVSADRLEKAVLEYTNDGTNWHNLGTYEGSQEVFLADLSDQPITATAVRVRNLERVEKWLKASEFSVKTSGDSEEMQYRIIKTPGWLEWTNGNQSEAYLHDGDDSTSAEYYHPGDQTNVGDFIGYDLGGVFEIGDVHIVVGGSRVASNKWTKYKLEYSLDNTNWITYKEYNGVDSGKDVIDENLGGIEARYIRITNMLYLKRWVHFSEFDVQEYGGNATDDYIYTNTKLPLLATHSEECDALLTPAAVTLADGEYIGFKFARIKDLMAIEAQIDSTALTLQISHNGIHWENVSDPQHPGIGRYVRLFNQSGSTQSCNIAKFIVTSDEVKPISLHSSTIGINAAWGDSRENGAAFDGDMNTATKFAQLPNAGEYIIYDLGQERSLWNIKLYNQDSDTDYIRDADLFVSNDLNAWGEAVMHIGDGVENTNDGGVTALQSGIYKTSSRYPNKVYAESETFQKSGRYLKILMTARNRNRVVQFNEIVLNDGEYVPEINDPTFESTPQEVKGFAPQNLLDGNLQSAYKPDTSKGETAGTLLYRISENCDTKRINIMQSGATISNAKVIVRGYLKNQTVISEKQIGELDKTLNAYENYDFDYIFEIEIQWEKVAPTIQEIILFQEYDMVNGDATALQDAYNLHASKLSSDRYTTSTKAAFDKVMTKAQQVIDMPIRTQFLIEDTLKRLNMAVDGLVEKASNIADFQALVDSSNTLKESDYAINGWSAFVQELAKAQLVYDQLDESTQDEVDEAQTALANAKQALVAKTDIQDKSAYLDQVKEDYPATDYTKQTHDALLAMIADYQNILSDESTITNEALTDLETDIANVIANLVDLKPLKEALADAKNNYGESAYQPDAWSAYQAKLAEAEAILKKADADAAQIRAAIQICADAKALLEADALQALTNVIADIGNIQQDDNGVKRYSDGSYQALQDVLTDAANYVSSANHSDADSFAWIEAIQTAKKNLVDIYELGQQLDVLTKDKEEDWYSQTSWDAWNQAIQSAQDAYDDPNVTSETVETQLKALRQAEQDLVDLRDLRKAISDAQAILDFSAYTPNSVTAFEEALRDALALEQLPNAQAKDISAVIERLHTALVDKADKQEITTILAEAERYFPQKDAYTEESFAAMESAYAALKGLDADENATQAAVDAGIAALKTAIQNLVKPVVRTDDQNDVEISATTAELPEDVTLVVTPLSDEKETLMDQLPNSVETIYPLDITLYSQGIKIQPNGAIRVKIRIPDTLNKERLIVLHVGDKVEEVIFTIDGAYVIFDAEHFSTYILAEIKEPTIDIPSIDQPDHQPNQTPGSNGPSYSGGQLGGAETGYDAHSETWLMLCIGAGAFLYYSQKRRRQLERMH